MSRNLSTNTLTAISAASVFPVIFLKVSLASGDMRLHTAYGSLTLGGETYQGTGGLLGVSEVVEDGDLASQGIELSLGGLDPATVALFLSEHYQGRRVKVWVAFFENAGAAAPLADPYELFSGWLDVATIAEDRTTATITARAESELIDLRRSRVQYYTEAGMARRTPGDRGFEYVQSVAERSFLWGKVYRKGEAGWGVNGGASGGSIGLGYQGGVGEWHGVDSGYVDRGSPQTPDTSRGSGW